MSETAIETPTFKKINGRWHIAQLCLKCRAHIWRDVHERPLSDATAPYCGKCNEAAGIVQAPRAS
jgi:hypothetical protein